MNKPSRVSPLHATTLLALALLPLHPVLAAAEPELLPPVRFTQPATVPTPDTHAPSADSSSDSAPTTPAPAMIHLTGEGIAGKVWVDFEPRGELPLRWEPSARASQLVRIVGLDYTPVNFRIPPSTGPVEVRLDRDPAKRAQIRVWLNNQATELIPAKPPRAVQVFPPQFPFEMRRAGKSGTVTVQFTITTEGLVASPLVLSSTNPGFDQAALATVAKWRFQPGELEGRPIEFILQQPLVFDLQKK
jgi:TonB family protein